MPGIRQLCEPAIRGGITMRAKQIDCLAVSSLFGRSRDGLAHHRVGPGRTEWHREHQSKGQQLGKSK